MISNAKARLTLLEKFNEERQDIRARLYQMIKLAADLERPAEEIGNLNAVLKAYGDTWWSLQREIDEARKAEK